MSKGTCSVEECTAAAKARGWCHTHYELWRRNGEPRRVKKPGYRAKPKVRVRISLAGVTCSIDDCGAAARCRGLCNKHYLRWRSRPDGSLTDPEPKPVVCAVDDCQVRVTSRGLCSKHYARLLRNGTTELTPDEIRVCEVEWCDRPHFGRGWCTLHYDRWREFGDARHRLPRDIIDGTRMCTRCRRVADLTEFGVDRSTKSGRSIYCGDCANELGHLRRVALAAGVKAYGPVSRREVFERDQWICQLCFAPIDESIAWPESGSPSLDHVRPIKHGGQHVLANLQAAHLGCNLSKGARLSA